MQCVEVSVSLVVQMLRIAALVHRTKDEQTFSGNMMLSENNLFSQQGGDRNLKCRLGLEIFRSLLANISIPKPGSIYTCLEPELRCKRIKPVK